MSYAHAIAAPCQNAKATQARWWIVVIGCAVFGVIGSLIGPEMTSAVNESSVFVILTTNTDAVIEAVVLAVLGGIAAAAFDVSMLQQSKIVRGRIIAWLAIVAISFGVALLVFLNTTWLRPLSPQVNSVATLLIGSIIASLLARRPTA